MVAKKTRGQKKKKRIGKGSRECKRCHTHHGLIRSYGINMCRRCFRETAEKMGFRKYN